MTTTRADQLTPLSAAILFALGDGARHGYAIIKEIEEMTQGDMRPNTGSMYLALHRLRQDGFIVEAVGPSEDARRRYYKLTPSGRAAATSEAKRLAQMVRAALARNLIPRTAL